MQKLLHVFLCLQPEVNFLQDDRLLSEAPRLNLNHPDVQAAYKAYCAGIGHPPRYPLSDWQRWDFEIGFVQRRGVGPDMPEWIRYQYFDERRAGRAPDTAM